MECAPASGGSIPQVTDLSGSSIKTLDLTGDPKTETVTAATALTLAQLTPLLPAVQAQPNYTLLLVTLLVVRHSGIYHAADVPISRMTVVLPKTLRLIFSRAPLFRPGYIKDSGDAMTLPRALAG